MLWMDVELNEPIRMFQLADISTLKTWMSKMFYEMGISIAYSDICWLHFVKLFNRNNAKFCWFNFVIIQNCLIAYKTHNKRKIKTFLSKKKTKAKRTFMENIIICNWPTALQWMFILRCIRWRWLLRKIERIKKLLKPKCELIINALCIWNDICQIKRTAFTAKLKKKNVMSVAFNSCFQY